MTYKLRLFSNKGIVSFSLNPLTPMGDQDRISPYNINIIPNRQVMRIKEKCQSGDYKLIQFQILQTNITRTAWQTVSRITNEILGVKGLMVNGQAMVKPSVGF